MNILDSCFEFLEKIENRSYRGHKKIIVTVDDVKKFIELYLLLSNEEKKTIYDCVTEKTGRILISFTSEMSARAIDTGNVEWFKSAILLHVIEGFRIDIRENYRVLIFAYFAGQALGVDIQRILNSFYLFSNSNAKDNLNNFFNRDQELNTLKSHGFKMEKINGETKFISEKRLGP